MCDYSLEMYRSRPAVAGERYESHRFPSGSVGVVAPGDHGVAVCMACDTRLELSRLPAYLQTRFALAETEQATFVRLAEGPYHDAVRFANGTELSLQQLGPGVGVSVLDTLTTPVVPAHRHADEEMLVA